MFGGHGVPATANISPHCVHHKTGQTLLLKRRLFLHCSFLNTDVRYVHSTLDMHCKRN